MELLHLILIFPSLISALGCSIFLFIYGKYRSVRLTFGMKYVAILQILDLLMTLINLFLFLNLSNDRDLCRIVNTSFLFFIFMQTFWVSAFSNYIYQVVYRGKDKNSISLKIPLILGIIISIPVPVLMLGFDCIGIKQNSCVLNCEIMTLTLFLGFIVTSFSWSTYTSFKSLKKIWNDARGSLKEMKWSLARLIVYPFITFICVIPITINYSLYTDHPVNTPFLIFSTILVFLIGFFNSVALGFTPELKQAIKLDRNLRKQSAIDLI